MKKALPSQKGGAHILQACLWLSIFLAGCIGPTKPQIQINQYLIDYPAPLFEKQVPIDDTLKLDRFTIASTYNNLRMIFRRDNCAVDSFSYSRWAVNPADMVADYLLRDLQQGGLFRAVFSHYALDEGRYVLQGGVEEFFLRMDKTSHVAIVSLEVTLMDKKQREATKRILFQRKYREEELLKAQSPEGFCNAMSVAVERLSRRIANDIYQAIPATPSK